MADSDRPPAPPRRRQSWSFPPARQPLARRGSGGPPGAGGGGPPDEQIEIREIPRAASHETNLVVQVEHKETKVGFALSTTASDAPKLINKLLFGLVTRLASFGLLGWIAYLLITQFFGAGGH